MKRFLALFLFGLLSSSLHAVLVGEKITLQGSMEVDYTKLPSEANSFSEVFTNGVVYGRLRSNMFLWNWNDKSLADNKAMGVGGSIVYKTAPYSGLSTRLGVYTSQSPAWFRESSENVANVRSGKDTFSRYKTSQDGKFGMTVLGQAYLEYKLSQTKIILGRHMLESVFTRSNDTKMIPNTFDGLSVIIEDIEDTSIKFAYMHQQKLRDHTSSHDVLAYGDGLSSDLYAQNDDGGVNRNLTVQRIGEKNKLIIASIENNTIQNLQLNLSYASVPDVLSHLVLESHYTFSLSKDFTLTPGIRYMTQFDNLGASYGVANVKTDQRGYANPNSLDSNLIALRVDLTTNAFLARLGYSKIADKADFTSPWRGFPTGGFTRAMAQYNFSANTKSYMLKLSYDFEEAKLLEGLSVMARYVIQDFDDTKPGVQADTNILNIDIRQNIGKNLEAKIRLGFVSDEDRVAKADVSYNEYRFELNYFF